MLKIKVIIDDGIVRGVLKDSNMDVQVEIIDTSLCYEECEKMEAFAQSIFNDPNYEECEYSVANSSIDNEPTLSQDDKDVLTAVDSAACMHGKDEIRVVADYDTGMINVEIIEQGEWMNRVAAIECCNLDALAKILDIRGVEHDF